MTPVDEYPGADDSDDEDDYDSEDYEDEEDDEEFIDDMAEEASDDELDDIDARIQELEEAEVAAKPSKKRRASTEADTTMEDEEKAAPVEPKQLSKKERKKLKNAEGQAVPASAPAETTEKSVAFTKETKPSAAASTSKKLAGGVSIDDRKVGEGAGAKNGSKISLRYVGKLKSGSTFDSNTSGKPFTFTVGNGEVIKGLDQGVIGLKIGGERRVTIPAAMGYASKALPGIPANSELVFDIKCLKLK